MSEIRLHGHDIELDRDGDLMFQLTHETTWFFFNLEEAIELRDFLTSAIAARQSVDSVTDSIDVAPPCA
jgi:hypothetical protein